jgi:methyl-accepting chemotaxis protein
MGEIVASVQRVTDIMAEISAASQEQSAGIEQVNQTVVQMDETTQQNAALVEEATAAARDGRPGRAAGRSRGRFRLASQGLTRAARGWRHRCRARSHCRPAQAAPHGRCAPGPAGAGCRRRLAGVLMSPGGGPFSLPGRGLALRMESDANPTS